VPESKDQAKEEIGEEKMCAPNVTSPEFLERVQFVKDHGGKCVMLDIVTAGFTALQLLRDMSMVIHAYRAMHAAEYAEGHRELKSGLEKGGLSLPPSLFWHRSPVLLYEALRADH